jgi:hypothetical protein
MPNFAQYEFAICVFLFCLLAYVLRDVFTVFRFGKFKVETTNGLLSNLTADITTKELIKGKIEDVDKETRKQERAVLSDAIHTLSQEGEIDVALLLHARSPLSTAVCDNGITQALCNSATSYRISKIEDVVTSVPYSTEQERIILIRLVDMWLDGLVKVNATAVEQKLNIYNEYYKILRLDQNREICKTRIEKNERYMETLSHSFTSIVTKGR